MQQPWPDEVGDDDDHDNAPAARPAQSHWWREALRSSVFLAPRWQGLQATPALVLGLLLAGTLLWVIAHRLHIVGPATFYWQALFAGWFVTVVLIGVSWLLAPRETGAPTDAARAPDAATLFALLLATWLACDLIVLVAMTPLERLGVVGPHLGDSWAAWLAWGLPLLWSLGIVAVLLWRSGHGSARMRAGTVVAVTAAVLVSQWAQPMQPWYPARDDVADARGDAASRFEWTPALLEAQAQTLKQRLDALPAQRPGVVDLYALTFAPYAAEDVFLRESRLVAEVMDSRFGAQQRSLQLINHQSTAAEWPWATPLNLERAIARIAQRMDRDEDLLFIHLTSHGAKSGKLSAWFWPIRIDELTPQQLKTALDSAGVRFRVISVSACYAGSWIAPLADDNTLVMTAADAEHTSYGCGRGSELTYFGRAVYDEALRNTWSFESALATARGVIEQREKTAGKKDGFSNPQIHVGVHIRERLGVLAQQRAAEGK